MDNSASRYSACTVMIITVTIILLISVAILLLAIMLPKNGFITETDENGNDVSYYYFDDQKVTGWHVVSGLLRYFDPSDGHMLTGKQTIEGKEYYFMPENGQLAVNRTITFEDGTKQAYNEFGNPKTETVPGLFTQADGTTALNGTNGRLNGWWRNDGNIYFFQLRTGRMLKNEIAFIDGKYYTFDEEGHVIEDPTK